MMKSAGAGRRPLPLRPAPVFSLAGAGHDIGARSGGLARRIAGRGVSIRPGQHRFRRL